MIVKQIIIKNFRNIDNLQLDFDHSVNVIYGDNGRGKTNVLEAIWLFTGNNSFRNAKLSELVKINCKKAQIKLNFQDSQREQSVLLDINNQKRFVLNSVPLKKASQMQGVFFCVVFAPNDLNLASGSPSCRRKFLDIAITQIKPQYATYLESYEKILDQRNALIKTHYNSSGFNFELLDVWDLQLAKLGTIITSYRNDYVKKLNSISQKIYSGITSKKESLHISYVSSVYDDVQSVTSYDDNTISSYKDKLKSAFDVDIRAGFTTVGIHRDDLNFQVDSLSVKSFGSQGQKRSCVIALKLAEAEIITLITKEQPIILLDDVMSELDKMRQNYILNHVKGKQVFITCCDLSNTTDLESGKIHLR